MNKTTSVEFRKTYPRLTEPTQVLAYGRVIGVWTPVGLPEEVPQKNQSLADQEVKPLTGLADLQRTSGMWGADTQRQRDAILKKMNTKGKA